MAKRDVFNRYSTVTEKLNQLNKQKIKDFQDNYNVSNIAQTISYQDRNSATVASEHYSSTSEAVLYESTVNQTSGYSETLTVSSLNSVLSGICNFAIERTVTLNQDEYGIYIEDPNYQPRYVNNDTGFEIVYSFTYNGRNYYDIVEYPEFTSAYPGDGVYSLIVPFTGYNISSTTFNISNRIYFTNGETVYGYSNLLIG